MAFLLALPQAFVDPEILKVPGLAGVIAHVSASDMETGNFNGSLSGVCQSQLELYCRINPEHFSVTAADDLWQQLELLQARIPCAKLVLPFSPQSLQLTLRSASFGWHWHVEGVQTLTQVALALQAGAGGVWIPVGHLDGFHELDGDELCSQTRTLIDERFEHGIKPLVIAADVRDPDHVERTLQYGCDRIVLSEQLWSRVTSHA